MLKMDVDVSSFEGTPEYIYTDSVVISSKKLPCLRPLRPIFESEERMSGR